MYLTFDTLQDSAIKARHTQKSSVRGQVRAIRYMLYAYPETIWCFKLMEEASSHKLQWQRLKVSSCVWAAAPTLAVLNFLLVLWVFKTRPWSQDVKHKGSISPRNGEALSQTLLLKLSPFLYLCHFLDSRYLTQVFAQVRAGRWQFGTNRGWSFV